MLHARRKLISNEPIDLSIAPRKVTWIKLEGDSTDFERQIAAARTLAPVKDGCVLIIGDSRSSATRYRIASTVYGAVAVEAVDLKDLVEFARCLDLADPDLVEVVAYFAQSLMTSVGAADLVRWVKTLRSGRARNGPSPPERAAISLLAQPSYTKVAELLVEIGKEGGVRTYRPTVMKACLRALQLSSSGAILFHEAAVQMREQYPVLGRSLPKRAVGSPLLLKGLEAETAIVMNADGLDSKNLYVAMTRGSMSLTVCSARAMLRPRPR